MTPEMFDHVTIRDPGEPLVTIDRHLYLTEDRSRVVEEGDPAGTSLWASPGQQVPRREAERLGALAPPPVVLPSAEEKQAPPAANKQRRPSSNKASGTVRPPMPDAPG